MAGINNFDLGYTSGATITLGSVSLNSEAISKQVTVEAGNAANVALNKVSNKHYGSLNLTTDDTLILGLSSDATGSVSISGNGASILSGLSFTGATEITLGSNLTALKLVNGSNLADTVSVAHDFGSDFVLNTNAGDDVIIVNGANKDAIINAGIGNDKVTVSVQGGNVVLGAGKDTLYFAGSSSTVNLVDYNFREDLISLDASTTKLAADGKLTGSNNNVVTGLTATNNLYLARLGDSSLATKTTVLATAAEDTTKVVVDASAVKAGSILINTEAADSAMITVGKGASVVSATLNSADDAGVDTLKIAETGATVTVTATNFNTDDVLSFAGLSFDKTTIGASGDGASLTNGKVVVKLGSVALGNNGGALFNLNGTKLYAVTAAADTDQTLDLTGESDLSKIAVKGNSYAATVASGIKTAAKWVDLTASNIYNINKVELTADTVAKASVVGTKNDKAGISIDASKAADGVAIWAHNSSSKVNDIITLGNADAEDTLWFGSADGKDSVTGFQLESDVLYLYDSTTLTADAAVLKTGKAEMSISAAGAAATTEEIMKVQGAKFSGTVYAAGDFVSLPASNGVIELGENAGKVNYYAVKKDAKVSISAAMTDTYTFLKSFDYAGASKVGIADKGSVASIDAGATTSDSKVIIEGVANVTLGAGTNEYWANGAKDAVVELKNGGADKIWFSASDKKVTVGSNTNELFSTESDVIALMGSIGEFTAKADATGNAVISNANKGSLTITGVTSDINLVDANGAKYKLYAGTANDDVAYSTNTDGKNIFVGAGYMHADSSVTDATTLVLNGANNKWGLTSAALVDKTVKNIDMNGSSADFILVGSAATANTITGGTGTNWLNGGGASKDTLVGVTGSTDNFYFGKEDGNDIIENLGAEDKVNLYDIATTDIAAVKVNDSKTVITLKNDSKLTINGGLTDGATFVLTDGTYVYDVNGATDAEKWVKQ